MNARRVSAAAGVILAAQQQRSTAAGIAAALEAAGLLQSPESAGELVGLRERVAELEAEVARPVPYLIEGLAKPGAEVPSPVVASDDVRPQVRKLRTILARQRGERL